MKKALKVLAIVIVLFTVTVAYKVYKDRTGESYYVQLNSTPVCKRFESGDELECTYKETAFDKEGKKKEVIFYSIKDRPLRKRAYLELKINPKNGVLTYKEVKKGEIPQKAMKEIEQDTKMKIEDKK